MDQAAICDAIEAATGTRPNGAPRPIGGGCINEAYQLGDFFVKTHAPAGAAMFEAEVLGLDELHRSNSIRVPQPVCTGCTLSHAFLVLEFLPLGGGSAASQEELGRGLSRLHRCTRTTHGWDHDNFIGATPQPNTPADDWIEFLRERRLGYMLRQAEERGFTFRGAVSLLDSLDGFFDEGDPPPALLHGDLWGGNASAMTDTTPVIYDPAVYYGDREADLAMTHLFGGFSPAFHAAYEEEWPLPAGHEARRDLYNLYHILNHAVLFGTGYARQAQAMIDHLLEL